MIGGLEIRHSRKDFVAEKAFGSAIDSVPAPIGRYEKVLSSEMVSFPLYQGMIPSCVVCSMTWVNMYNSLFRSKNPLKLSWPFVYSRIPHYEGGTVPQDGLNELRKFGQPSDEMFPQSAYLRDNDFESSTEAETEALKYRIKGYSFIQDKSLGNIHRFLAESPLIIGLKVDPLLWGKGDVYHDRGEGSVYHAVVLIDFDADGNLIIVDWGDSERLDIKKLAPDTDLKLAITMLDIPDGMDTSKIRRGLWQTILEKLRNR